MLTPEFPEFPGFDLSAFDIAVELSGLKTNDEIFESCKASPTAFENWFPVVEALKIRTPKTQTIPLSIELQRRRRGTYMPTFCG